MSIAVLWRFSASAAGLWAVSGAGPAVTGYFGQNVPYPGFGIHWGFLLSLTIMISIATGLYLTFRHKGWI